MEWIFDLQNWIALLTLTSLEIVLGIDNIIFISIMAGKLPEQSQGLARKVGLGMAMITRILLLLSVAWLTRLTTPLFYIFEHAVSGRSIILIVGGLFLLGKSTTEIHDKLEGHNGKTRVGASPSFRGVVFQIMILDIVFSLDSVITAVGMANQVAVMVIAIIIAVLIMMFAAGPISDFVNHRPTLKILALSFLLLIGVSLIADGAGLHIPKGYIYFAMAFSFFVEVLNLRLLSKEPQPVRLHPRYVIENDSKNNS
jgi:predicted tellurium resistance membrane protein TerC